ncbi:MAG: hypothetical protein JW819_09500 [Candidatus Krumholzibacteriota bacterium]|nr:hypothetical protein [Candidatus Krumholzibacteriota bacterium]
MELKEESTFDAVAAKIAVVLEELKELRTVHLGKETYFRQYVGEAERYIRPLADPEVKRHLTGQEIKDLGTKLGEVMAKIAGDADLESQLDAAYTARLKKLETLYPEAAAAAEYGASPEVAAQWTEPIGDAFREEHRRLLAETKRLGVETVTVAPNDLSELRG